jgi:hypothetical protein
MRGSFARDGAVGPARAAGLSKLASVARICQTNEPASGGPASAALAPAAGGTHIAPPETARHKGTDPDPQHVLFL